MVDLGLSEQDAKKYTHSSGKKVTVKCPDCEKEKEIAISKIYNRKTISCSCKDGISYPEKFMIEFFNQLKVDYKKEYSPNWANKKRYDFYFRKDNEDYIIETHGEQHYKDSSNFSINLEEQISIDNHKKKLAIENLVKEDNYIVLDCRVSSLSYIKNSILNSKISKIFDLKTINWLNCERYSLSNRAKEICDYWHEHKNINKEDITAKKLCEVFQLDRKIVLKYLKRGTTLGWCYYNAREEKSASNSKNGKTTSKKVIVFTKQGEYVAEFSSCHEAEELGEEVLGVKLNFGTVAKTCRGEMKSYRGFVFRYATEIN